MSLCAVACEASRAVEHCEGAVRIFSHLDVGLDVVGAGRALRELEPAALVGTSASCGPVATSSGSSIRPLAGAKNRTTRVLPNPDNSGAYDSGVGFTCLNPSPAYIICQHISRGAGEQNCAPIRRKRDLARRAFNSGTCSGNPARPAGANPQSCIDVRPARALRVASMLLGL